MGGPAAPRRRCLRAARLVAGPARRDARRVLLGIRPEDIYEAPDPAQPARQELAARVVAVEPLGAETLIVLTIDGAAEEVIARSAATPRSGRATAPPFTSMRRRCTSSTLRRRG